MDKVAVFFDLISGFLVTIDIAAPSWGQKFSRWLGKQLPRSDDTVNPLRLRTFLQNVFMTFLALLILISYAISKDISAGAPFQWSTVGLFLIGVIVGIFTIFILSIGIQWARRVYCRRHGATEYELDNPIFSSPTSQQDANLLTMIWPFFIVLGMLTLLLLRFATGTRMFLAPITLTLVLTIFILPTVMLSSRFFTNYIVANPEKPHYALARIGLIIFVISKIIYLVI